MTPVQQTDTSKERGDCQRASVATLFDFEIDQVPNFRLFSDEQWWSVFICFIWGIGFEVIDTVDDNTNFEQTIDGYLLASVNSDYGDGYSHAVVINTEGEVVHDPLPTKPNLGMNVKDNDRLSCWYLIRRREISA